MRRSTESASQHLYSKRHGFLAAILGPATIVSVAYIDPGNFGSNIAAGSRYGLNLLWVVWLSGLIAILYQYLSGKIGLATSKSVVDLVIESINKTPSRATRLAALYLYFIGLVAVILATDMAEFLGVVIGIYLLFKLPLTIATLLGVLDVLVLMMISDQKITLETVISSLVGIVGISLIYESLVVGVDPVAVAEHSVLPTQIDTGSLLLAVSILGATVMPHAVLLHSYLTADKWSDAHKKEHMKKHVRDVILNLSVASVINASIQIVSYYAFYRNGYHVIDVESAYKILQPLYGENASLVFAVAILASGISSSMVSILFAQRSIESYLRKRLSSWRLRLYIRLLNMIPMIIAIHLGISLLDILVYTQAVLSLVLPVAIIPVLYFSSSREVLGEFRNNVYTEISAFAGSIFIIGLNIYFLLQSI